MSRRRVLGTAALAALPALLAIPDAHAASPGTGTSSGGSKAVHVRIGDGALDLQLFTESSDTTNEATPGSAVERVVPLSISSTLVPVLGALSTPAIEVASDGSERSASTPGADLGALSSASPVPGALAGTIDPASLRAVVDAAGAVAAAAGGASGISILGGVVDLGRVDVLLGSNAGTDDAAASRGLSVDRVEALDLGAVLSLLGLSPADLPLDVAARLLEQLGVPLPGGAASADALVATVNGLLGQVGTVPDQIAALDLQADALLAQLAPLQSQLDQLVPLAGACDPVAPILGQLGIGCPDVSGTVSSLQSQIASIDAQADALLAQIDALLTQISGVLNPLLDTVNGLIASIRSAPLVVIEDLVVGLTAKAGETLDASSADIFATVGNVRVGTISVPNVDLIGTLDQLDGLANQLTGAVDGVLGTIDPALAGMVEIKLAERTESVREEDGRTIAEAAITGLRLRITPPDLCGLLGRLGAADTISGLLADLAQTVPATPLPVADVLGDLGSVVTCTPTTGATVGAQLVGGLAPALTQPLTVEALTVSGKGSFAAPIQVPVSGRPGATPLPRTGGEPVLLLFGALAAASAVGLRRVTATAKVSRQP